MPGKARSEKATIKGKLLAGASLGLVLAGLLFGYFMTSVPGQVTTPVTTANKPNAAAPSLISSPPSAPAADQENSGEAVAEGASSGSGSGGTLKETERDHLSDVFLNSVYPLFQSDFQLNRDSRSAIDVFVASMPADLSNEDLDDISTMIETQLRTPESEDLAFIITHLYRLEQEEARLMNQGEPVTTMDGQLEAQKRISQLRDEWFGPELSERLFNAADDDVTDSDPGKAENPPGRDSTEEPSEAQAELADTENAWERRYQAFLSEKKIIDRAGLDQTEKDRQIEALLQQHYETPGEIEAVRAYGELPE
jgi:hypothetical protein